MCIKVFIQRKLILTMSLKTQTHSVIYLIGGRSQHENMRALPYVRNQWPPSRRPDWYSLRNAGLNIRLVS